MIFLTGALGEYLDVAQVALYLFWGFFFTLILYLHRESKREGYPLVTEHGKPGRIEGFPGVPSPKTFILPDNRGTVSVPRPEIDTSAINARATMSGPGSPLQPTGDPMLSGIGPGAYAARVNWPDLTAEGHTRIVPMRLADHFAISPHDPNPIGMAVIAGDGVTVGNVTDVWVDQSESIIRYYEVQVSAKRVLLPVNFANVSRQRNEIGVNAIYGKHFAGVPTTASPDQVSRLEEDRICAYYGGGLLFADPKRMESLL